MPLGMEVGLSPGDCVRRGHSPPPTFSAHVDYSYCDFVFVITIAQSLLVLVYRLMFRKKSFKNSELNFGNGAKTYVWNILNAKSDVANVSVMV